MPLEQKLKEDEKGRILCKIDTTAINYWIWKQFQEVETKLAVSIYPKKFSSCTSIEDYFQALEEVTCLGHLIYEKKYQSRIEMESTFSEGSLFGILQKKEELFKLIPVKLPLKIIPDLDWTEFVPLSENQFIREKELAVIARVGPILLTKPEIFEELFLKNLLETDKNYLQKEAIAKFAGILSVADPPAFITLCKKGMYLYSNANISTIMAASLGQLAALNQDEYWKVYQHGIDHNDLDICFLTAISIAGLAMTDFEDYEQKFRAQLKIDESRSTPITKIKSDVITMGTFYSLKYLYHLSKQNKVDFKKSRKYQIMQSVLESDFFPSPKVQTEDDIVAELRKLIVLPTEYNPQLTQILSSNQARDLDELIECSQIESSYQVVCRLGKGSSGTTYKVFSPELKKYRALKIINDKFSPKEAELMAKLENKDLENIVQIYEAGEHIVTINGEKKYAILMEYVDGKTIEELCQDEPIEPNQALNYSASIFNGIRSLRSQGITHRDLNLRNIKVNSNGIVKILDFGIATDEPNPKRKDAARFGVPSSMDASDIYSLGLIIYQLTAGKHLIVEKIGDIGSHTHRKLVTKEKEKLYGGGKLRQQYRQRIEQNIPLEIQPIIYACLESKDFNFVQQTFEQVKNKLKYYFMDKEDLIKKITDLESKLESPIS